uniref:Histone-lysine N-methyltransferase, H3 lysine-9 specific SUVH6 n=1 Tax=Anthurium amnicola TaxID=1678845 RepID=A0A1D1YPQ5_9ARAE
MESIPTRCDEMHRRQEIKPKKEVRTPKRKSLSLETSSVPGNKAKKEVRAPKRKRLSFESSLHQPLEKSEGGEDVLLEDGEDERALIPYHETEELSLSVPPFGPSDLGHDVGCNEEAAIRIRVRKALRLFQVVCRKLLQGEESRSKNRGQRIRVDLMAANILKEKNEFVNAGNPIIGSVPGVEVGDEFHYRAELCVVGLHRLFQGGIDFTTIDGTTLAICIVASVGHTDEMDSSDVLIYSGSGGSAAVGDQAPSDQKLQLGNLGLKNCIDAKTPVRVIRGIKELRCNDSQDGRSKPFSTFTYDGLYLVEEYWPEEGPQGFSIYKFKLRRIPGQPEIALKEIKKSKKSALREGLCIADISEGKEKIPISVVNTIDDERPTHFEYVIKMIYRSSYAQTPPNGCDCTKRCADSESCACAVKNGGEIPFNFNGAIVQAKPLVYECGPSCKCPPSCHNRVSQRGIKIRLEIFKTQSMGWGVRSLTSIPSGTFICEYIGELIPDKEAEQRSNDEYLFDIGHNYDDHDLWEGLPTLIPDLQSNSHGEVVEEAGFTIDAAKYGNVGRFINHSCSPNLYAQNVLYDHDDKRMPHIMLFAAENIPPLQELTYHYNYTIGQVRDSEGNMKTKDCHCGSLECTGRLY